MRTIPRFFLDKLRNYKERAPLQIAEVRVQKGQGRARKRLRATAHKKTLVNREKLHQSLEESDVEL
mgnify:CR=1 FL=1